MDSSKWETILCLKHLTLESYKTTLCLELLKWLIQNSILSKVKVYRRYSKHEEKYAYLKNLLAISYIFITYLCNIENCR